MTLSMKTEYIEVPGGFVCLCILGENEKEIPVLYLHGGPGGNFKSFSPMAQRIAENRVVYMYNQLGSDEYSNTGEESLWVPERYVEALNSVIANLNVPKLHIIGHSWGAYLAAEHILSVPKSPVVSITMVSPYLSTALWIRDAKIRLAELNPEYLKAVEECEGCAHFDDRLYQEIIEEYEKNFKCRKLLLHQRQYRQLTNDFMTVAGKKVYRHMWGPSEFTCTGILKNLDITDKLNKIKVAVLLICGQYDQVRNETCEYYRSLIPGSRMAIMPDASQMSFLENPDIFYNTLMNFYSRF